VTPERAHQYSPTMTGMQNNYAQREQLPHGPRSPAHDHEIKRVLEETLIVQYVVHYNDIMSSCH